MKAVTCYRYGLPQEVLQIEELDKPSPKANEVLVQIHATAVNDYDWAMVRGRPHAYRLFFGLFKPKRPILGMELAGTVTQIGTDVTKFQVGDEVYGDTSDHEFGTMAEYMAVSEDALIKKPSGMSFEQACSISHASMLAYQSMFDIAHLQPGHDVLINGAGGGVGSFALQLAKLHGCRVTGVDTGEKLRKMLDLGFDEVIDYKLKDFTDIEKAYDLIIDCKTSRNAMRHAKVLKKGGIYVTVGGRSGKLLQIAMFRRLIRWITGKEVRILMLKANKDLDVINQLFSEGKIKCTIDGPYPLEDAAWAIQRFGDGKHVGKIVLKIIR